jgi:hypothetical protein
MHMEEIEGELRRILVDHARAVEERCQDRDRPLRRKLYEIILEAQGTENEERQVFIFLAFLSGGAFVLVVILTMLAAL